MKCKYVNVNRFCRECPFSRFLVLVTKTAYQIFMEFGTGGL